MRSIKVQRVLIANIRRHALLKWAVLRAELRREFACLVIALPTHASRRRMGKVYRQRKAAIVIATARQISICR
jgi:hypothetical protein